MDVSSSPLDTVLHGFVYVGYLANFGLSVYMSFNYNALERRTSMVQMYLQTIMIGVSTCFWLACSGILFAARYCQRNKEKVKKWEKIELMYVPFALSLYWTTIYNFIGELWITMEHNVFVVGGTNSTISMLLIAQLLINITVFVFNFYFYKVNIDTLQKQRGMAKKQDYDDI